MEDGPAAHSVEISYGMGLGGRGFGGGRVTVNLGILMLAGMPLFLVECKQVWSLTQ